MSTASLLSSRVVLVTGKGGVGKSTCAVALAVGAARAGKRVLLLELNYRAALAEILQTVHPGHQPTELRPLDMPGLWGARLDPQEALTEYLSEQLGSPRLVRLATDNRVLARLWRAMPSVDEMALLNAIYKHEQATQSGQPRFDHIVVDMPATGHAVFMLSVPKGTLGIVKGRGGIGRRAKEINEMMQNSDRVSACVVTLPEELPVNESIQLVGNLTELGIDTSCVLINSILADIFTVDEHQLLEKLGQEVGDGPGKLALNAAGRREIRRLHQVDRIGDIRAALNTPFLEVAHTARRGLPMVNELAATLVPESARAA